MQKIYSKGISGLGQLALLIGLVGGGLFAGSIISLVVWKIMGGGPIASLATDMLKPRYAAAIQAVQVVSTIFMFVIPTIIFAFISYRNGWTFLGFKGKWDVRHLLIVVLLVLFSFPLMAALEEINRMIPLPARTRAAFDKAEQDYNATAMAMIQLKTWGQYFVSIFVIALMPAISEEMVFRGGLQNLLTKWTKNPWVAILITSFLFSIIHLSWYGFFVRFVLGVVLGLVFYYTKNIWLNILLHFLNNAIVVTSLFFAIRHGQKADMAEQAHLPIWIGGIGLLLMIVLVKWLKQISSPEDEVVVYDANYPFEEKDLIRTENI